MSRVIVMLAKKLTIKRFGYFNHVIMVIFREQYLQNSLLMTKNIIISWTMINF